MKYANYLIDIIRNKPDLCSADHYHFQVSNARFWIANGFWFFFLDNSVIPNKSIGFYDRWRIWRAFKVWAKYAPESAFTKT
jgi:hypothetical protein